MISISDLEFKYHLLLSETVGSVTDSDKLLLAYLTPYIFPAHLFETWDCSHEALCVDTLNPPVLRLFQCRDQYYVVGIEFRVTYLSSRAVWDVIKAFFNDYIHLYPYRVGFLNIQLLHDDLASTNILRIGDSYVEIAHPLTLHHIPSDMPPVTVAYNGWLLGVALLNGIGTLFLHHDGRCERIRLSSCVLSDKSRLALVGDRILALTGTKADVLGEIFVLPPSDYRKNLTEFLRDPHSVTALPQDAVPTFAPLWCDGQALGGVVAVAGYGQGDLCVLKQDGDVLIYDFTRAQHIFVGNIGEFETCDVVLLASGVDVYVQFTRKSGASSHERAVSLFHLTEALREK